MRMQYLQVFMIIGLLSCKDSAETSGRIPVADTAPAVKQDTVPVPEMATADTIALSGKHHPNTITCDLDGDLRTDSVQIVQNTKNSKYGLKIIFGNKNIEYLGMGATVVGQDFDDIGWAGIFKTAPKGDLYWNNVSDEGEIISDEDVKEEDKIRLPNDGIFIHEAEACGGGVIYLKDGKFEWIQQE